MTPLEIALPAVLLTLFGLGVAVLRQTLAERDARRVRVRISDKK